MWKSTLSYVLYDALYVITLKLPESEHYKAQVPSQSLESLSQ